MHTFPNVPVRHDRLGSRLLTGLSSVIAIGLAASVALVAPSASHAVVNGTDAALGELPYQVVVDSDVRGECGGVLVSNRVVVTAAHCVMGPEDQVIEVRAGGIDKSVSTGWQSRLSRTVAAHPEFRDGGSGDIAVIVLTRPFQLTARVQPIKLATTSQLRRAVSATLSGWGGLDAEESAYPDILQKAELPMISAAECGANYADIGLNPVRSICAGAEGLDSCGGDSGGPLAIATSTGPRLVGIVNGGGEYCGVSTGGTYASVPYYSSWINGWRLNPNKARQPLEIPLPDDH